ncbi:SWIM zinc finger family protein [Meiothermus ruber]|uniref:Zinc finger SWIM domain protein n=1 Tax=Meiothermus ruber (strain ATCC 35948 / DSM 1279 / VKM B-1258 / 21) TaxID=504728 RepID=D3PNF7_MEIRD|nr:SWIM zinc finger family protein [Meiothermus ruber]ADD27348.1 zinc finger SWIM domain protein [Meiothermus ruber DSM 1279]AGK03805.1 zinc finger SWIM domain-containing protein [Meiothermus ruber DSM 1279]
MKNIRERVEGFLNRLERAEGLLLEGRIHRVEGLPHTYVVRGSENYLVNLERETCTCPDHARGHTCKHLLAAVLLERGEKKGLVRTLNEAAA